MRMVGLRRFAAAPRGQAKLQDPLAGQDDAKRQAARPRLWPRRGFCNDPVSMDIEKKLDDGRLSIRIAGRLDTNTSPELEAEMNLDGVTEVFFDLSELEYVSSAGLRIFLSAQKAMMARGGSMTISKPNAIVKGVFDITGCSDIFTIV